MIRGDCPTDLCRSLDWGAEGLPQIVASPRSGSATELVDVQDSIDHVGQHRVPRPASERHRYHRLTIGPAPNRATYPDDAGRGFEYRSEELERPGA